VAVRVALLLEDFALDPIGALQAPGRRGEAKRKRLLQRARGREIVQECRLMRLERAPVLVRDHDEPLCAKAVLQRVLRRARLAVFRSWPVRLRAVAPARLGACVRGGNGDGNRRAGRGGACCGHGGIPCWVGDAPAPHFHAADRSVQSTR
jgi:hypothetical protein